MLTVTCAAYGGYCIFVACSCIFIGPLPYNLYYFMINQQQHHDNIFLVSLHGARSLMQRFDERNLIREMLTDISLEAWQQELPPELYCRVHHTHFLCLPLIERFEPDYDGHGGDAVLANGIKIRVSRQYLQQFHHARSSVLLLPCRSETIAESAEENPRNAGGGAEKSKKKVKPPNSTL